MIALVPTLGLRGIGKATGILENLKTINFTVTAHIFGRQIHNMSSQVVSTQVSGKMESRTVKAPTFGRMVINLLVNGEAHAQVVSWKVLVFTLGMMELCTLGNFQQRVPAKEESTVMAK